MDFEESKRATLEFLAQGKMCDYAPLLGGVVISDGGKALDHPVTFRVFSDLRIEKLIEVVGTIRSGHSLFPGRVDSYAITDAGRTYLAKSTQQQSQ